MIQYTIPMNTTTVADNMLTPFHLFVSFKFLNASIILYLSTITIYC